jgi:hypothetical protein
MTILVDVKMKQTAVSVQTVETHGFDEVIG